MMTRFELDLGITEQQQAMRRDDAASRDFALAMAWFYGLLGAGLLVWYVAYRLGWF